MTANRILCASIFLGCAALAESGCQESESESTITSNSSDGEKSNSEKIPAPATEEPYLTEPGTAPPGVLVSGRVTRDGQVVKTTTEDPLIVQLIPSARAHYGLEGQIPHSGICQADGSFQIPAVAPGKYYVRLASPSDIADLPDEDPVVEISVEDGKADQNFGTIKL